MGKDNKVKVIKLIATKAVDDKKESNLSKGVNVIDIRKNQIDKMIDDIVSINKREEEEDLLEM
jgi:hypothetical protein